jgi:hypothetical protein
VVVFVLHASFVADHLYHLCIHLGSLLCLDHHHVLDQTTADDMVVGLQACASSYHLVVKDRVLLEDITPLSFRLCLK